MSHWGIIDKTLEGRQRLWFPHYMDPSFPKHGESNATYRKNVFREKDLKERQAIYKKCSEDFLFYLSTFVYMFRAMGQPGPTPFNPYDFQVECFTKMWKCLHEYPQEDLRIVKPRYVGATWMVVALFEHAWHFMRNLHFLLGSRNREEVDGATEQVSLDKKKGGIVAGQWSKLLPKFDFIHLHQPPWMWPEGYRPRTKPFRTSNKIINPTGGGLIEGQAASEDWGRSGRYYATGYDEMAHTDNAHDIIAASSFSTECHFWWSSPKGPNTAFTRVLGTLDHQIKLNFFMMPEHSEGLTIDPETGKKDSPALQKAFRRVGFDQVKIKNEIWADEEYAVGCFYPVEVFEKMDGVGGKGGTVRDPRFVGELDIDGEDENTRTKRFIEQPSGRWSFWQLEDFRQPNRDTMYILSIDAAAGSSDSDGRGASNSVIGVADWITGEIVAEFVTHGLSPHRLARIAAAAGYFFSGSDNGPALIIFETGGPGSQFYTELRDVYRYPNVWSEPRSNGKMDYGWVKPRSDSAKDPERRPHVPFGLHLRMLLNGRLIERSEMCSKEMKEYQHTASGGPVHSASIATRDPTGARQNHGDRVITRLCICAVINKWRHEPPKSKPVPGFGSYNAVIDSNRLDSYERGKVGDLGGLSSYTVVGEHEEGSFW